MAERPARILIAEDERQFQLLLQQALGKMEGHDTDVVGSGAEALAHLAAQSYDLILLDIMMPDRDGISLCRDIRLFSTTPIIFITALGDEEHVVAGLHAGADDYITKPFSIPELTARVRAALRRGRLGKGESTSPTIATGELEIDIAGNRVLRKGEPLELTGTELKIMLYLARHMDRIITQDQLLSEAWGPEYVGTVQSLHAAMSRLRTKIEPAPPAPQHIKTRHGIGYMLVRIPPSEAASTDKAP